MHTEKILCTFFFNHTNVNYIRNIFFVQLNCKSLNDFENIYERIYVSSKLKKKYRLPFERVYILIRLININPF